MKIPSNNRWTQTNEGKKLGVLGDTFNVNLETPGQLIGAKKSVAFLHEDNANDLSYIIAIPYYANDYIAVSTDEAYRFSLTSTSGTTISGYPSGVGLNSDAVVCFNRLYLSLDNNLAYWDGSSVTTGIEALTTSVPHPMDVFDSLPTFKLAIGNGNEVILVDSSGNKDTTSLLLPAQFRVTTLRYRNGYLYVGTRNIYGGEARVFIWNGSGTNAQYEVPTGASWVFSMVPYMSSVAFITDMGQLLTVNGTSAQELASLPIYYKENTRWQDHLGLQLNGKVFNRGMEVIGDSIYINLDGEVDIGECLEMKSGIWIYNPQVGLYHHAQGSNDRIRTDSSFSVTDSVITTSATHYLKTGDAVVFTTIAGLTGVTENKTYYAEVLSATTLKLAESRTALQNDIFVEIGGTSTSDVLLYAQNRDQGIRYHSPGAIGRILAQEIVPTLFAGQILYGARVDDLDGNVKSTVQILTDSFNVSRFTTQRIYSESVEQSWKGTNLFIDGLNLDNELIAIKYNNKSKDPRTVLSGTWLDANTVNVLVAGQDTTNMVEGDEIVFTDGYGRGYSSKIEEIEKSAGVYSITTKDEIGTANTAVEFFTTPHKETTRFTNNNRTNSEYVEAINMDNVKSPWVTLSAEMRGFQTEVSHYLVPNIVHKGTK